MTIPKQSSESVLFITLDSCRFDTFEAAHAPAMKSIGPVHKAQAPSYFTYGSHSAMFTGFTPGVGDARQSVLNPKYGKLFKLVGAGFAGKGTEAYQLEGRTIIDGFRRLGFRTLGTGALGWFNPDVPTGRHLTEDFDEFLYTGSTSALARQVGWVTDRLSSHRGDVFVFMNVGETHVPYYFDGAAWDPADNPCVPFQTCDRSAECRERQRLCCEFVDASLAQLLNAFRDSTVLICSDHGDCWGEDGLWEHGISHPQTLTVPLIARVRGVPVVREAQSRPQPASLWAALLGGRRTRRP